MFGWYKLQKFYPQGLNPSEWWDRMAEGEGVQWDDPEEYRKQLFYPLLMNHLEKGKKYLDAWCGLGGWLAFLRARGFDVEGVEGSKRAVELIKQMNPDLPIKIGDLAALPYEDNALDGYITIGSWEFKEDGIDQLMGEAKRVLKTGGVLFLEVPYANPFRRLTYLPLKNLEVFIRQRLLGQTPTFAYHIYRKGDILGMLKESDFEILEFNPHDLPAVNSHYGLWIDWPWLRGKQPYELNQAGLLIKKIAGVISPWMIATGMFVVARKK